MIQEMSEAFRLDFQGAGFSDDPAVGTVPDMHTVFDHIRRRYGRGRNPFVAGTELHAAFQHEEHEFNNRENRRWLTLPEVQAVPTPSKRRLEQPRVRLRFESLHDIQLRLLGTCVFVGAELYYVKDIVALNDDYLLVVVGKDGKSRRVWYACPLLDLRSMEPQYVAVDGPVYVYRPPMRSQKQGMSSENLRAKRPGPHPTSMIDPKSVLPNFGAPALQWSSQYAELMAVEGALPALRLSKDVAFYRHLKHTQAEFRGRPLGYVHEDTVYIDSDDARRPWVTSAIQQIGCQTKTK